MDGIRIVLTNVHMDYQSILNREKQIINICEWGQEPDSDFYIITGDFNSDEHSSIYRYLTGRQSLSNRETNWHDLTRLFMDSRTSALPTLDFINNSRWKGKPNLESPMYCDWILLRTIDSMLQKTPLVTGGGMFGKNPIVNNGTNIFHASDHYGQFVDICW